MAGASSLQVQELGQRMRAEVAKTEEAVRYLCDGILPALSAIEYTLVHGTREEQLEVADRVNELRHSIKAIRGAL